MGQSRTVKLHLQEELEVVGEAEHAVEGEASAEDSEVEESRSRTKPEAVEICSYYHDKVVM